MGVIEVKVELEFVEVPPGGEKRAAGHVEATEGLTWVNMGQTGYTWVQVAQNGIHMG